jgi:hypothetical protein
MFFTFKSITEDYYLQECGTCSLAERCQYFKWENKGTNMEKGQAGMGL